MLCINESCKHSTWVLTDKNYKWWRMTGSNRRPPACKAGALPAELIPQDRIISKFPEFLEPDLVGLVGLEPTTPALSTQCSNQLSYRPSEFKKNPEGGTNQIAKLNEGQCCCFKQQPIRMGVGRTNCFISRKEVIQPHLPIRLPCYDFTPVTNPAVVIALLCRLG